ncbi:hypothetical protein [Helicobacter brantae]|uniref:Capsule biosynthesis protein n=1 Tax=Helicobacter brantae TaxID=375927 RepID=A0A3D8J3T3_9HELI|nr:hypothetical protein [Helicobacter brantae]RDU72139.1 hypothetical protein CQA58_00610 [Helicobacter brantae]
MSKKIILIDRDTHFIRHLLKHTDWEILCLVLERAESGEFLNISRIKHIVFYDDLLQTQHSGEINLEILELMRDIQLDCETTIHRCFHDNNLSKYIYYNHLSFFYSIFQANQIDFVLCSEYNLGVPSITIPLGLSKIFKIPSYTIDADFAFSLLYRYNDEKYLQINSTQHIHSIDTKAYISFNPDKISWSFSPKKIIKNILQKIGGQMLIEFCVCLIHLDFNHYDRLGIKVNYWEKLRSFLKFKKAIRFYHKNAVVPDLNRKFIYFSLHVEPEAVILARVGLDNQLLLIKMLSEAMPQDWVIYVKEHPHQLKINNPECSYFINNIDYYKSIEFYKEITKMKNVQLINLKTHPKELTIHSKAVASIGGSISTEAWLLKKPAINFCPKQSLGGMLSNSLGIESYQDVKKAIDILYNHYDDFTNKINTQEDQDKLQAYLFPLPQDKEIPIFLETILNDIKENPCN